MVKDKMEEVLDDGSTKIQTTKTGWDKEDIKKKNIPVLLAGWKEGQASHHPISLGLAKAVAENDNEDLKNLVIGQYNGVPVLNPIELNSIMLGAFCDKYGIEVSRVRVAGMHGAAKKELDALKNTLSENDEVMAILKEKNPALYKQMGGE